MVRRGATLTLAVAIEVATVAHKIAVDQIDE
jgi:hypothetical protein